jgi:hypothetical protein
MYPFRDWVLILNGLSSTGDVVVRPAACRQNNHLLSEDRTPTATTLLLLLLGYI